jgi:UrcA family protein
MDTIGFTRGTPFRALALAALACACVASPVFASTAPADSASEKVTYRDLNIGTPSGAATLYQRIRAAARDVCGEEGRGLDEQRAWRSCYHTAVSEAVAQVNNPLLTQASRGQSSSFAMTALLTP